MSLSREFNTLSGKIISIAEFRQRLQERGLDPDKDAAPSRESLIRKMASLQASGEDLSDLEPAMYLSGTAVAEIEKKALTAESEDIAYARIADGMKAKTADGYFEVFPAAKVMALFYDDQKVVESFISAAKECLDYRKKVDAGELRDTMSAFEGMARKVEAKFNR